MNSLHLVSQNDNPSPLGMTGQALERSRLAQTIAQLLFSLNRREQGVKVMRLQDADRKEGAPFLAAGEMVVQMTLHPDLERTAMMAAAVECYAQDFPATLDSLFDRHGQTQIEYFQKAQSVVMAYMQTLQLRSTDPELDEQCCRLFDALEQKGQV